MNIVRTGMTALVSLAVLFTGISNVSCATVTSRPSLIEKIAASNMYVYPMGITTLTCMPSTAAGGKLMYYWSCDDGSFEGESGPVITWRAPNKYGKFHIMVMVDNGSGITDKASISIEVVVNETAPQCPACGR